MTKYVLMWQSTNVSPGTGPHIVGYVNDIDAAEKWVDQSPSIFVHRYFLPMETVVVEQPKDNDGAHPVS